jgi:hypothetical protein
MTNLQDIVVKEMKVKKHIDSQQEIREIIQFIKNYVQSHTFLHFLNMFCHFKNALLFIIPTTCA